jgi:hypothetical protein
MEGEIPTMKYFSIFTPAKPAQGPTPEDMAKMGKLMAEGKQGGWLLDTGGLMPLNKGGVRARRTDGQITVMDGPYAEAKEVVAGWAILKADSREGVIGLIEKFLAVAGDGECEVFQIPDFGGGQ